MTAKPVTSQKYFTYHKKANKVCVFKLKYKIMIGNTDIEVVDKIKYLGVIIDRKLTFKEHVSYIGDKISRTHNFFLVELLHL